MSIPNVCITWCYREAKCPWCDLAIKVATPCVSVFFWRKGNPEIRGYNIKRFYHPECWIDQGLDYLKMNPYTPRGEKRGPKTTLTIEQKAARMKLLRKKAMLEQQKRRIKSSYPDSLLTASRIDDKIMNVMLDIYKVGGIPPRWKQCLIDSLDNTKTT